MLKIMRAISQGLFLGHEDQHSHKNQPPTADEKIEWMRWQNESGSVLDHVMSDFDKTLPSPSEALPPGIDYLNNPESYYDKYRVPPNPGLLANNHFQGQNELPSNNRHANFTDLESLWSDAAPDDNPLFPRALGSSASSGGSATVIPEVDVESGQNSGDCKACILEVGSIPQATESSEVTKLETQLMCSSATPTTTAVRPPQFTAASKLANMAA